MGGTPLEEIFPPPFAKEIQSTPPTVEILDACSYGLLDSKSVA